MDRAEATGFGVAAAGHLVLLGILSLGFANAVRPPIVSKPMEVSFVEEVGLESSSPTPTQQEPAPKAGEIEGPVEPSPPPPAPEPVPEPLPQPRMVEPVAPPKPAPVPKPTPKPVPKAVAPTPKPVPKAVAPTPKPVPKAIAPTPKPAERTKPAPAKPAPPKAATRATAKPSSSNPTATAGAGSKSSNAKAPARPTGRLGGLLDGISDKDSQSRSTTPPAKVASAAVQSSLGAEIRRQLKPHWRSPTGADAEKLRTELRITLAPNGAVTDVDVVGTTGVTDSNRPQVKLHQEQAVKAARLASPFRLPAEFYDAWKQIEPSFDKRLSQ